MCSVHFNLGIFDPTHPELVAKGVQDWGEWCLLEGRGNFDLSNPKLAAGGYNKFGERSYHEGKALFDRKYDGQQIGWRIKGGSITGKNNRDNRSGLIGKKMDEFEKN